MNRRVTPVRDALWYFEATPAEKSALRSLKILADAVWCATYFAMLRIK